MTLGLAERQGDLLDPVAGFCDRQVGEDTIYGLLHRERHRLFPDEMFTDLYTTRGRRSVPPSVLVADYGGHELPQAPTIGPTNEGRHHGGPTNYATVATRPARGG